MSHPSDSDSPSNNWPTPGAPLPLDSILYIERAPIETLAYQEIDQPGSLLRIKATRKMGKSSLLHRVIDNAHQKHYKTAFINFHAAEESLFTSLDRFLRWFCINISHQLGLKPKLESYWDEDMGSKVSCTLYVENHLLHRLNQPFVLALDGVHRLFEYPEIARDFLTLLRFWHEQAKQNKVFQMLRLILSYTTEVSIEFQINQSPFNVGQVIQLPPLTLIQIQTLVRCYGLTNLSQTEQAQLQPLREIVGGHPYLIQLALYHLAKGTYTLTQIIEEAPTAVGIYSDHLRHHLAVLRQNDTLAHAFRRIVTHNKPVTIDALLAYKLNSMGLIHLKPEGCVVAYDLYRQYFSTQNLTAADAIEVRLEQLTQENQALKVLVHTDALTQVGNRRYFDNLLEAEWQRLALSWKPLALLMCDIDFFKQYNNSYGHPLGDSCLRQVAGTISATLNAAGLTTRYGGEEFAVILPETDIRGAVHIANAIRTAVKALSIPHVSTPLPSGVVTLSIGAACLIPNQGNHPSMIVRAADEALYQSKHRGRDCVTLSSTLRWGL